MEVRNEMGVIVEFIRQSTIYGFEVLSVSDGTFPDAIIQKDGLEYKTEFEFKSSNFNSHRHDIRVCDLIVCWENDTPDFPIPIVALSDSEWTAKPITPSSADSKEAYYWKIRAYRAERRLSNLKDQGVGVKIKAYVPTGLTIEQRQEMVKQMDEDELTNEQVANFLKVSIGTVKNDKRIMRELSIMESEQLDDPVDIPGLADSPTGISNKPLEFTVPANLDISQRRELVNRMSQEGMTIEAIAKALGCSVGTVKNDKVAIKAMADPADLQMSTGGTNGHGKG